MPFQKGHKLAKGRVKGSQNKDKAVVRSIIEAALGHSIPDEIMKHYEQIRAPMDKINILLQIAPYCYAKLQSIEVTAEIETTETSQTIVRLADQLLKMKEDE